MDSLVNILGRIGKSPETYFGTGGRSLHVVEAFLIGYQFGIEFRDRTLPFNHFNRWVAATYRVTPGPKNGFTLIREHVGGDESIAFDEFFRLLPAYANDMAAKGPNGIYKWFGEVMGEISGQK